MGGWEDVGGGGGGGRVRECNDSIRQMSYTEKETNSRLTHVGLHLLSSTPTAVLLGLKFK